MADATVAELPSLLPSGSAISAVGDPNDGSRPISSFNRGPANGPNRRNL